MDSFDAELQQRLLAIREQGLLRELRRVDSPQGPRLNFGGRELLNFSSNDYLGLANHPALKEAAIRAVEKFGAGAGASRLICGSLSPYHELEETLAAFKGTPAALTFATGSAAAIGTIPALIGKGDIIITDKLVHACIVDAARLSGAQLRIFAHNDLNDLEEILKWADSRRQSWSSSFSLSGNTLKRELQPPRTLIVTESVFSMDGDHAPLADIVALKDKYGAWLMVDEAHATGLYGPNRRGRVEDHGVCYGVEIQMGTLGKALGGSGGYVRGSRSLIDLLVNRARSFIFSTAPVPAAAAAATAGIQLVQSQAGAKLAETLWTNVAQFQSPMVDRRSFNRSAIIPIIIGDEIAASTTAAKLREQNIFVPAIRYPTVARGLARLRVTLTAAHSAEDITKIAHALKTLDMGL